MAAAVDGVRTWLLSEQAGRDVRLESPVASYLALGVAAPESTPEAASVGSG